MRRRRPKPLDRALNILKERHMAIVSWLNAALDIYAQIITTVLNAAFARSLRSLRACSCLPECS
jgi:hypothetical protein